jgi:uncharacterized membrane protein
LISVTRKDVGRLSLAAFMTVAGSAHFIIPESYARIVPRFLGHELFWVRASGIAELGCAALLAVRRTAALGGWATASLFVIVFPANVQMALDGGLPGAGFPASSALLAWLRLPLQIPLILWAVSVARKGRRADAAADTMRA